MKKKLFLRLCLMFLVGVSAFSCRTEEFHNEEEAHGNTGLRLTSRRISLNESKHKTQLLTEIDKAENTLKSFTKMNVHGKVVNYGNGVSIDTDHVIYIENGPNYHTYTFHITRDNAPADAPLENLLLSPLPDGTYREILITYTLTEAEKAKLQAGLFVDTRGKTEVTRLENGTFNGSSQLARQVCTTSSYSYWEACSGNQHHDGSNYESCPIYQGLEKGTPPIFYTIVTTTCLEQNEMIITPVDPPNNGGGSSGGGSGETAPTPATTPPCTTPSVPTNPQPGFTDENGCIIGIPTQPIVKPQTPCSKIKAKFEDTKFKEKYNELNKPENFDLDHEKAFIMRYPPIGTNIPPSYFQVDMPPCSTNNEDTVMPSSNAGLAGLMHTHTNTTCSGNYPIKVPSPVDIKYLLNTLLSQANQYTGSYSNAYSITITSEGSYMLMYTGTNYPGSLNYDAVKQLKEDYKTIYNKLMRDDKFTQPNIEREFVKFMKEKINKPGLEVYKVTPNSAIKLEYDPASPNSIKETPCPQF
ncbi:MULTISPECIES: hypothetical protein [Chryseobacterium]|uniref:DUF4329 domain-containing protein n=1 Tax=Chryseobacterium taihuense TaxID=1141221 RepID=A0A4U8WDI7_9FLAO|nr:MULTISPECIES: hypothetical protein [Chryseobacterium]QQV02322.1 hypothetical protein I6I61_14815 [Chryseobacterium sp. FDAARGOS 1104]VFB04432.1 Uncharacterised protein [Chryseobacterium taihuense]